MLKNKNESVESLIRDESPKLRRFFRTKAPDSDVLDLVQQTLETYLRKRGDAAPEPAYLWGIARNIWRQHAQRIRGTVPFDSATHTVMQVGGSHSSALDRRARILEVLHELPADIQMAVELGIGEELSHDDVAAALGVSVSTVKRYLDAAKKKLRAAFGDDPRAVAAEYRKL